MSGEGSKGPQYGKGKPKVVWTKCCESISQMSQKESTRRAAYRLCCIFWRRAIAFEWPKTTLDLGDVRTAKVVEDELPEVVAKYHKPEPRIVIANSHGI